MEKPKIQEVIAVEGRYDKNTLLQVVDASVLELGGFGIFNDREKTALLRRLAETRGIILFTDPDGAGFVIRNRLKGAIPTGRVLHAYVPDVYGKEKRKRKAGKEGKLGVEGMPPEVLLSALDLTVKDLLEAGKLIHEDTLAARNFILYHRMTDTVARPKYG